jgi:two-component system sensor histidine kinase BaeS
MTVTPSRNERLALLVHEVRSPVAALAAIADAARDEVDEGSLRELARLAVGAVRSIERIVVDAALGSVRVERVDLGLFLQDVVAAAALRGGEVRLVVDEDIELDADPVRLRQAVDNLIRNAIVHSGSLAGVVVRAAREERSVLIDVTDYGRGIARADQQRIFERGTTLDGASAGTGLGLDLVREIAGAHGGTVTVDSEPGSGATFTIAIPMRGVSSPTGGQ